MPLDRDFCLAWAITSTIAAVALIIAIMAYYGIR